MESLSRHLPTHLPTYLGPPKVTASTEKNELIQKVQTTHAFSGSPLWLPRGGRARPERTAHGFTLGKKKVPGAGTGIRNCAPNPPPSGYNSG